MNSLKRKSRPVSVLAEFAMPARIFHMSAEKELELSVGVAVSCEHAPSKAPIARPSLSIHNWRASWPASGGGHGSSPRTIGRHCIAVKW